MASGRSASASGSGDATISFKVDGDFAVVVELDCGKCKGTRAFMAEGAFDQPGPLAESSGSYLMAVMQDDSEKQEIWLETQGDWSVKLKSWNDLTPVSGKQSGTGSTVMWIDGKSPKAKVKFTPANSEDEFSARYYGVDDADSLIFGDTEAFNESFDIQLPGVLAIKTEGKWSFTPTK